MAPVLILLMLVPAASLRLPEAAPVRTGGSVVEIESVLMNRPQPPDWVMRDPEFVAIRSDLTSNVVKLLQNNNHTSKLIGPRWLEEHTKDAQSYMEKHPYFSFELNHFVDADAIQRAIPMMLASDMGTANDMGEASASRSSEKYIMTESFLTGDGNVCYEPKKDAPPGSFEWVFLQHKLSMPTYALSYVNYGESCEMRGYTYDTKPHPCYPKLAIVSFKSEKAQEEFRAYRQNYHETVAKMRGTKPINVTDWMVNKACGGLGTAPFTR